MVLRRSKAAANSTVSSSGESKHPNDCPNDILSSDDSLLDRFCCVSEERYKRQMETFKYSLAKGVEGVEIEQLMYVDHSFFLGNHPQIIRDYVRFLDKHFARVLFPFVYIQVWEKNCFNAGGQCFVVRQTGHSDNQDAQTRKRQEKDDILL